MRRTNSSLVSLFLLAIFFLTLQFINLTLFSPVLAAHGKRKMSPVAQKYFDQGRAQFAGKKYQDAVSSFSKACQLANRNNSCQFYLGTAALYTGNQKLFVDSMTRIVVMNGLKHSVVTKRALVNILKYSSIHPYSALNSQGLLCRWDIQKHPVIYVYISRGLALPKQYQGKSMNISDIKYFQSLFKSGRFASTLVKERSFGGGHYSNAMSGLRSWDWAVREGLFKYAFTNDPNKADIVVLWTPKFTAGGDMKGLTSYFATSRGGSGKVIMQLYTGQYRNIVGGDLPRAHATHEFGHAFGLGSHSPNGDDIMSAKMYQINGSKVPGISNNDKATLRALYSLQPDMAW